MELLGCVIKVSNSVKTVAVEAVIIGNIVVLLLCAGDKSSQQKDINKAIDYLRDFKERN